MPSPFYPVPPGLSGRWISQTDDDPKGPVNRVVFVRSDFSFGKTVYISKGPMFADGEDDSIDVDWLGEWVAWTVTDGKTTKTAFKRVADPPAAEPSYLNFPGRFQQWTEDSNMLFVTATGMAVLDRSGKIVRQFNVRYAPEIGNASWRHYGHR